MEDFRKFVDSAIKVTTNACDSAVNEKCVSQICASCNDSAVCVKVCKYIVDRLILSKRSKPEKGIKVLDLINSLLHIEQFRNAIFDYNKELSSFASNCKKSPLWNHSFYYKYCQYIKLWVSLYGSTIPKLRLIERYIGDDVNYHLVPQSSQAFAEFLLNTERYNEIIRDCEDANSLLREIKSLLLIIFPFHTYLGM